MDFGWFIDVTMCIRNSKSSEVSTLPTVLEHINSNIVVSDGTIYVSAVVCSKFDIAINDNKSSLISFPHIRDEEEKLHVSIREDIHHFNTTFNATFNDQILCNVSYTTMTPILKVSDEDLKFSRKYFENGYYDKSVLKLLCGSVIYNDNQQNNPHVCMYVGYDFELQMSQKYYNYLKLKEPGTYSQIPSEDLFECVHNSLPQSPFLIW